MTMIVKSVPIRKNNRTYRIGEEFPYKEKDKSLLWNLMEKPETQKASSPQKPEALKKKTISKK